MVNSFVLMLVLAVGLAIAGCQTTIVTPSPSTGTATPSASPTPVGLALLPLRWSYDLSAYARGVAAHPSGSVALSVGEGAPGFPDGGGIVAFDADGDKIADFPMRLDIPCSDCTRPPFNPEAPLVSPDGSAVYASDTALNLFRVDVASGTVEAIPLNRNGFSPLLVSIDRNSAISSDGRHAFLPGLDMVVLNLETGTIEREVDLGPAVRQIVRDQQDHYLINVSVDTEGRLIAWEPESGVQYTQAFSHPIRALASAGGWTVAVVGLSETELQLVELTPGTASIAVKELARFDFEGAGEPVLALRTSKRQVVIGSTGTAHATDNPFGSNDIKIVPGSTVLVSAEKGVLAGARTSSVRALAISPDDGTLYVADTGGLKAFVLPQ